MFIASTADDLGKDCTYCIRQSGMARGGDEGLDFG